MVDIFRQQILLAIHATQLVSSVVIQGQLLALIVLLGDISSQGDVVIHHARHVQESSIPSVVVVCLVDSTTLQLLYVTLVIRHARNVVVVYRASVPNAHSQGISTITTAAMPHVSLAPVHSQHSA
jgi:hypothetical protein